MKKLLLFISASGMAFFASAQTQPTWDFESWTGSGASIEPTGWISGNAITGFPFNNPQSVFQETTAGKVHGGTYSMKLVTVDLSNNPDPSTIPDPMGAVFPGQISISPLGLKDGFAYAGRPNSVEFWYQYAPVGGDSASAFVLLSKWNSTTNMRDTVAVGGTVIKTAANSYVQGSFTLLYLSATLIPDSMRIYFTSTCYTSLTCGTAGSTLWVDDITFTGWNGVNENISSAGITVYPNPASDMVQISVDALKEAHGVNVYDAMGKMVCCVHLSDAGNGMNRKVGKIDATHLAAGVYSYSVTDKSGNMLRAGSFNVAR